MINKQANIDAPSAGAHFNRTFAADMNLVLSDALTIDGFFAGTETQGLSGDRLGGHIRAGWLDRTWRIYAEYTDLDDNFNPEVGYVPRVAMRRSKFHFERDLGLVKLGQPAMAGTTSLTTFSTSSHDSHTSLTTHDHDADAATSTAALSALPPSRHVSPRSSL